MSIIILEGVDKCGKTTIAKFLEKKGFRYVHFSQPEGDPYIEYIKALNDVKRNENIVFDRLAWGELVYGPIYRGKSKLSLEQLRNIEMLALQKNAIVIYCYDSIKNIKKRFKEDGESFAKKEFIKKMLSAYNEIVKNSVLPVIKHQMKTNKDIVANGELENTVNFIDDYFGKEFDKVIGSNLPIIAFIGDKRNNNVKYREIGLPFDFGISSKFLFEQIKNAKIPFNEIALLNSDNKNLKKILKYYNDIGVIIVALGKNASKKIGTHFHHKIEHPQYTNRFKKHNNDYANQLKEIYGV